MWANGDFRHGFQEGCRVHVFNERCGAGSLGKLTAMDSNNGATSQVTARQERGNVFRGLYRTVSWAYVTSGAMAFQVPEAEYRAFGYEPDYDKLPWKESYDAARAQCASGCA